MKSIVEIMKIAKMPDGSPEIYLAVQGEGKTIGTPIVFVRCSVCNLHCVWCDTFYTWNFEGTPYAHDFAPKVNVVYEQMDMTPEEVVKAIKKAAGEKVKAAVFTGGEPTIQQKHLVKVAELLDNGWYFEIETNGTIKLIPEFIEKIHQINCSPKLATSGNDLKSLRDRPEVIAQFIDLAESHGKGLCFKFVVTAHREEQDIAEIEEWIKEHNVPEKYIYLMPEGTKRDRIIEGSLRLNEICMQKGWKMSTRLQVILYGEKRAV